MDRARNNGHQGFKGRWLSVCADAVTGSWSGAQISAVAFATSTLRFAAAATLP